MVKTNFFEYLNFALQFAPPGPEEKDIRAKLARIGVGAGKTFEFKDLSLEHKAEVLLGMKEGDTKVDQYLVTGQKNINGWKVGSLFGDRALPALSQTPKGQAPPAPAAPKGRPPENLPWTRFHPAAPPYRRRFALTDLAKSLDKVGRLLQNRLT